MEEVEEVEEEVGDRGRGGGVSCHELVSSRRRRDRL
jgi:hypothetical protein